MKIDEHRFKNFMKAEEKFINDAKYYEGIHTNKDPGDEYIIGWIKQNAEFFRKRWNNSKCKDCKKGCGDKLKEDCDCFEELK